MLVTVTVALDMLVEVTLVAGCEDTAATFIADCDDATASNCCGGGARNVSFVGSLQSSFVPQQAQRFVLEL